jgi:hypothetical protein
MDFKTLLPKYGPLESDDVHDIINKNHKIYKIKLNYFKFQENIKIKHRKILVEWLYSVVEKFDLQFETYLLTINYLDRYCSIVHNIDNTKQKSEYQLIGISCLMIAAKYEEIYTPDLSDYTWVCDRAYNRDQIKETEVKVLKTLNHRLCYITPQNAHNSPYELQTELKNKMYKILLLLTTKDLYFSTFRANILNNVLWQIVEIIDYNMIIKMKNDENKNKMKELKQTKELKRTKELKYLNSNQPLIEKLNYLIINDKEIEKYGKYITTFNIIKDNFKLKKCDHIMIKIKIEN